MQMEFPMKSLTNSLLLLLRPQFPQFQIKSWELQQRMPERWITFTRSTETTDLILSRPLTRMLHLLFFMQEYKYWQQTYEDERERLALPSEEEEDEDVRRRPPTHDSIPNKKGLRR